ncbi:hypothetical protein EK0264_13515 [Epidermidibacterium keratini]|uniref:DUF393 domain-containing protein n=1 Tax=Epidermidibacterium keratini TaxID=1891644 RepID=A0A7L4YPJ3_9ACTN|nr:hypothetical protein [Epidermidibacterium keratini]QHC01205.1 hypothetical protein EK0264_13515 [Epidermidibacterium keratini]
MSDQHQLRGVLAIAYDGSCPACSALAQYLTVYRIDHVVVIKRDAPALRRALGEANLSAPSDEPFALDWTEARPTVRTGLAMRIAVARAAGVRRGPHLIRLLLAEQRARRARKRI